MQSGSVFCVLAQPSLQGLDALARRASVTDNSAAWTTESKEWIGRVQCVVWALAYMYVMQCVVSSQPAIVDAHTILYVAAEFDSFFCYARLP